MLISFHSQIQSHKMLVSLRHDRTELKGHPTKMPLKIDSLTYLKAISKKAVLGKATLSYIEIRIHRVSLNHKHFIF
jgi:hypothetical protein